MVNGKMRLSGLWDYFLLMLSSSGNDHFLPYSF
jgi:hypothetical protein